MVTGDATRAAVPLVANRRADDAAAFGVQLDDALAQRDLATACGHLARRGLPHLAGPELGIEEPLDEARLRAFLARITAPAKRLRERMRNGLRDRKPLDSLRAPLRGDLRARHAPDFLRVILEERAIQPVAEAVHEEILERHLRAAREEPRLDVARAHGGRVRQPEIAEGRETHLEWIVEELAPVVDARETRSHE